MDEDGNEKRVSSQLTERKIRNEYFGCFFPLVPLSILVLFSLLSLCPACLVGEGVPPVNLVFCIFAAWAHVHVLVSVSSETVSCPVDGLRAGLAQPMPS